MANLPTRRPQVKRVNIDAPTAIRALRPPILGKVYNVTMTTGDILKCLCKRAKVDEILPDGTTVRLNMSNYYMDNSALAKNIPAPPATTVSDPAPVQEVKEEEKVETKVEEEPAADEVKPDEDETSDEDQTPTGGVAEESTAVTETANAAAMSNDSVEDESTQETKDDQVSADEGTQAPPQIPAPPRPPKGKQPKKHR